VDSDVIQEVTAVVIVGPNTGHIYLDAGLSTGHGPADPAHYVLADDTTAEEAEPCRSFTADPDHPDTAVYCEHTSGVGHGGLHYAVIDGCTRTWTTAQAAGEDLGPTHADLPEAVTPCGLSSWDVPASTDLAKVDCVDCLRTLAQAAHGDRLPEEDLVEPGDEVPALAELADRVAAIEERLDAAGIATPGTGPARYRDKYGNVWEETPGGTLSAVEDLDGNPWGTPTTLSFAYVSDLNGPLTPVTDEATGGAE
jgi:hypothetical protein